MEKDQRGIFKAIFDKFNFEDHFSKVIGVKLTGLESGFAKTALSVTEEISDTNKLARLAVIYSVADMACEAAGNSIGKEGVAIMSNILFFSPAKCGDILEATAKMINQSDDVGMIEFQVRNQQGAKIAAGTQQFLF